MIEFSQVNKTFGGHPAVKNLSLRLEEGAFSVLIGTSGSGKSTTLKMINRLVEPDSGMIRFAGQDIREHQRAQLRRSAIGKRRASLSDWRRQNSMRGKV